MIFVVYDVYCILTQNLFIERKTFHEEYSNTLLLSSNINGSTFP